MNFDKDKLVSSIKKLADAKVLVVGDLALDEMIYGDAERISREAPVLILQHTKTKHILGGASNAAHNVATLNNGKVGVVGVAGEDYHRGFLFDTFKDAKINCDGIVIDKDRKTIVKTRISGSITTSITQQIVRIDRQSKGFISEETENKILAKIEKLLPEYDAVILSNYHIGTL
ncbi:D-glycero-beta-D-manno-heptose-7-phosphate kinase, partial [bacterium]|nr:D-glycero-beta-D-manno-heptose-7-phosphate kinase [bacterium]